MPGSLASALSVLLLAATALGSPPPFDFTGHGDGRLDVPGATYALTADLSSTGSRTFTGAITAKTALDTVQCSVRGKRKRKVRMRTTCSDGRRARLAGLLDVTTDTIAGIARVSQRARHMGGRFVLTRTPPETTSTLIITTTSTIVGVTTTMPPSCGNDVIEAGEECDDGNTVSGDGCSSTCTLEGSSVSETEPNDTSGTANAVGSLPVFVHGSVQPQGDQDFFAVVVDGSGDITFETFDGDGPGHCDSGTDTILELRDQNGISIIKTDDDGGISPCSKLSATGLTPGTYFICVRGFGMIPAYQLLITTP